MRNTLKVERFVLPRRMTVEPFNLANSVPDVLQNTVMKMCCGSENLTKSVHVKLFTKLHACVTKAYITVN